MVGMGATPAQRNLAAEVRAVEEGHQARLDSARRCFTVKSDSTPGVSYDVRVTAGATVDELSIAGGGSLCHVECSCPAGQKRKLPGVTPCKHGARVLERLLRHGLVVVDLHGLWRATVAAEQLTLGDDATVPPAGRHLRLVTDEQPDRSLSKLDRFL